MRSRLVTLLLLAGLGVAANPRAVAGAELLDSFALPSTPDGTTPLSVGGGAKKWVYPSFCSTGSFVQTFPLNLQFSGGTGAQTTVHFSAKGNLKNFATVPADVLLTDDGSVQGPF